jgi:hypothetical protein
MIKISQQVQIYEEDDREIPLGQHRYMGVESHWNRNEMVILEIGKERVTVLAGDLRAALENAKNTNRF